MRARLGNCTKIISMDQAHCQEESEVLQAQIHIYKHVFNYIDSMSLKCAVQLGIPDVIHKHNQPITLPELVSALQVPSTKTSYVHRLMRLLVHSGFFATTKVHENQEEEGYVLTPSSRLLLKDNITSLSPNVLGLLDPGMVASWHFLGEWFHGSKPTPFETAHGMHFSDYRKQNLEFSKFLMEGMANDSRLISSVIQEYRTIFEGLNSLVDLGGGVGTVSRAISEAFPHLKCTVLDLPHVVANLPKTENLDYVGGDMFQPIPSADAVLIKSVLHMFSDEDCVKVLKRCREAIPSKNGGKVIIIDRMINEKKDEHELTKAKLCNDVMMMIVHSGRDRNEKDWEKLFLEAGFSDYKITIPTLGLLSLIEVYP